MIRSLVLALSAGLLVVPGDPASAKRVRDLNHSTVGFSVPIMGGLSQVTGKFADFTAEIEYDPEHIERSKVLAVIRTSSVSTGIAQRDTHLRSAGFFDSASFPEIIFESRSVRRRDDQLAVTGDLTLRDVTQEVGLEVTVLESDNPYDYLGFLATTTIDRREFGVLYQHDVIPDFVGNQIEIAIHILSKPAK